MPNCIFQLFRNWKKWELANFAKLSAILVVNFSFILRPFLLERKKLPLCEVQLILWLEKFLQHVITIKELTFKKFCRRTWVWCVLDINEILCCNWNVQHKIIATASKILEKNIKFYRRNVWTLLDQKSLAEPLMITPSQNFYFLKKQIESKKAFLILAFKTITQKSSVQDFFSYPIVNLNFCDHISRWIFLILKVEFHYQGTGTIACSICGSGSTCTT